MKKTLYLLCAFVVLAAACKKKETTTTTPVTPTAAEKPYNFKFTFDGTSYNLRNDTDEVYYPVLHNYDAGGKIANDTGSVSLSFEWDVNDTVKESNVLALAGKTIYVNDTATGAVSAILTYYRNATEGIWYSEYKADPSYKVTVSSVSFLKKDTSFGTPLRAYLVAGTCKSGFFHYPNSNTLTGGSFKMVVGIKDR